MSFLIANSFIFNGINCHDYNLMIGWMDNSTINVSTNGLNREIKKNTFLDRIKSNIYTVQNTDTITFNFCVVKKNGKEISRPESIKINQWLTSPSLPQKLIFNDGNSYPLHYYAVCTQVKDVISGSSLIGKELTFETNSSYAFTRKSERKFEIMDSQDFYINNSSDVDIYYPTITISTKSTNIVIENVTDKKSVTLDTTAITADNNGNKIIQLNSEKMNVLDKDKKLIPVDKLGWNETYKSYISSIDDYMDNIYWVRLLKGINQFKVTTDNSCIFKIECEYPRKAGCL